MEQSLHISNFPGLYREETSVREKYFLVEQVKTRCINFGWQVEPHFHSYLYQIFFVKGGTAEIHLNAHKYKLEAPFLIYIPPNYIHGFSFSPNVDGDIISFSNYYTYSFFKEFPIIEKSIAFPILLSRECSKDKDAISIIETLLELEAEFYEERDSFKDIYIHVKLASLLLSIASLKEKANDFHLSKNSSELDYFRQFLEMVKTQISPFQPIEFYAKKLGVSLSHLNRLCKTISNDTPLSIIQYEIISMAKILLLNDKINVSDVAYSLGFNDPSYFIRLFKKKTGMTPKAYKFSSSKNSK
ncbi:helix-turn-helix domain-containing protein [Cloacibacterium sp.]|uniref:helix-turn-helix domain-containing protein n=1 Tax=Cloacibacterium sp. TaxID=1913682 RepID=UPI0039E2863B